MLLENSRYPADPRVRRESLALKAAGYEVTVICPTKSQRSREVIEGVSVYRFPAPKGGAGALSYLWEYGYSLAMTFVISLGIFIRYGFDVIHTANPPDIYVLIGAFYKPFGIKFVFDHHDLAPEMYRARFPDRCHKAIYNVLVLLEKLSCKLADHVIATNDSYREIEMIRGKVPSDRITIVRNGPDDLLRFRSAEPFPELRQSNKVVITYAGTMGIQDGVDHLLRALRHLVTDFGRKDFLCVLVGNGIAQISLKQLATQLELDPYVRFPGFVSNEDFARYLCSADLCVDPDPSNPFNDRSTMLKMMDYMCVGKAIVAFDLPEHRVTAQAAAKYVRPNDDFALAEGIAELIDDPAQRKSMGEFGRRRAETELLWQHSANHLIDAYARMLSSNSVCLPAQTKNAPANIHVD